MSPRRTSFAVGICATFLLMPGLAHAVFLQHIINGGFETGNFSGWTVTNSSIATSVVINDGSFDPDGPTGLNAPISGNFDALFHQFGPSTSSLFQQVITLPTQAVVSSVISWDDRIFNHDGPFAPNQEFRVLLESLGGANLLDVFHASGPNFQPGPNARSVDVTAFVNANLGASVQLSFENQAQFFYITTYLDNVSWQSELGSPIPEPGTLTLLGLGLAGAGAMRRRKRRA